MLKILWVSNYPIPRMSELLKMKIWYNEGWKISLLNQLAVFDDIKMTFCFPTTETNIIQTCYYDNINVYAFPGMKSMHKYDKDSEQYINHIITSVNPDIIHIWGTELPHSLAVVNVCKTLGILNKIVVSLHGLVGACAMHYKNGVPENICSQKTLFEIFKYYSINEEQQMFYDRSIFENQILLNIQHVIGRTEFDRGYSYVINPKLIYHFCNESLRESFYSGKWSFNNFEKHSIFISQATYPIKGFHFALQILHHVKQQYPDVKMYVAGNNIFAKHVNPLKRLIIKRKYTIYLEKLITDLDLTSNIVYLGALDESQMKEAYLKSNVFLSCSTIENESNSLSEAKILGVPCVASYVGGVTGRINHGIDGYLYQHDAPYMAAYYIMQIFSDMNITSSISENAQINAKKTHNKEHILNTMLKIYNEIKNKSLEN